VFGVRRRNGTLWAIVVVAVVIYLAIVDLGVSAGRIHHGVEVTAVDLGGLTRAEATARLQRRASELANAPVTLTGYGLDRTFSPAQVVWRPMPGRTASAALSVGRTGGALHALWDRVRSWFITVDVAWVGRPDPKAMVAFVARIDRDATKRDLQLDRALLRKRLKQAMSTWPRRPVRIPLKG
jgi:hypothetical protein